MAALVMSKSTPGVTVADRMLGSVAGPRSRAGDEMESRLSGIINLIEDGLLTHEHICRILKRLIGMSKYSQIRTLWTALQPLLHRDFMFMSQNVDPEAGYQPISTALSRDVRSYLTRTRNVSRYHRVQSAYLTNEEEVFQHNKLPPIETGRSKNLIGRPGETERQKTRARFTPVPSQNPTTSTKRREKTQMTTGTSTKRREKTQMTTTRSTKRREKMQMTVKHADDRLRKRLNILGNQKSDEIEEKVEDLYTWYENWSNPDRALFFRKILPRLAMKQLYFLSTYLSVRQHCDFISKLPKPVALTILSYLSAKDLASSSIVCKKWNKRCLAPELWEEKCDEVRSEIATPAVSSRAQTHYDVYRSNHIRQRNWSRARCSHAHLEGHEGKVLSVAFNSKIVVSGGADSTVRVWNTRNAAPIQILTGHSKGVWCVAIFTNVLVISGSYDHTIKVWNIYAGTCLRTLFGHTGAIWTLACREHLVATGSHDKVIKLWDMSHCKLIRNFVGHSSAVFTVDLSHDLRTVFSGSADHSVRIWGVEDGKCLKVLWAANSAPIMSVTFEGGYLAYAAHNVLNIWDVQNGSHVKTFKGHKCRIENVKINVKQKNGEKFVSLLSAGRDGRVKHWRLGRKDPVKTMVAHKDCQVNCVAFDKKRLISALYDNSICMCDFSVVETVVEK